MITTAEGWPSTSDPWHRLVIGTRRVPAHWKMKISRNKRLLRPAKIDITVTLHTAAESDALRRFVDRTYVSQSSPHAIRHPECQQQAIRRVLVVGLTTPRNDRRRGTKVITIKCHEYIRPRAA